MKLMFIERVSLIALVIVSSCATPQTSPKPILPRTKLPKDFMMNSDVYDANAELNVHAGLLTIATVVRKLADIREGPGAQFTLYDSFLKSGESVIILRRVGPWQKVISLELGLSGWVHHKALSQIRSSESALSVRVGLLPRIFAMRDIRVGYSFERRDKIDVAIPKGANFIGLKQDAGKLLVLIQQTQSLLWLDEGDAG